MKHVLVFSIFCLLGGAVYHNALNNPFQLDDIHHIEFNPHIKALGNIPSFFRDSKTFSGVRESRGTGFHYRPLLMVTYAVNYWAGGIKPVGYHIVNLAFHAGSAYLIFLIVKAMLDRGEQAEVRSQKSEVRSQKEAARSAFFAGVAAGLIFLVHPLNSELINYISARSSVMSGFFYLLAFYCWVKYRDVAAGFSLRSPAATGGFSLPAEGSMARNLKVAATPYYLASLLAFAAGMLTKEIVITLPAALWLYDLYFYFGGRSLKPAATAKTAALRTLFYWRTYIPYLPFMLFVAVPYLLIRASWLGETLSHAQRDIQTQFFTELPVLIKYWSMFLIPYPLSLIHDAEVYRTFWNFHVISSFIILTAYITVAVFLFRASYHSWRIVSYFMFWFLIVLLPTTIIPLNLIFQENRGYLAMVTFAVIMGILLGEATGTRAKKGVIFFLVLLIGAYSAIAINRNRAWKDDLTLWTDTVASAPHSSTAYTGLGIAYKKRKMYDQAIGAFQKALERDGDGWEIRLTKQNLADVYISQNRLSLAAQELENVLKFYPRNTQLHNDLGVVYGRLGRGELAEREFHEAAKIEPSDPLPHFNLGILYTEEGRITEAINAYRDALSLAPAHKEAKIRLRALLKEEGKK